MFLKKFPNPLALPLSVLYQIYKLSPSFLQLINVCKLKHFSASCPFVFDSSLIFHVEFVKLSVMEYLPDDVSEGMKFFVGLFCLSVDVFQQFLYFYFVEIYNRFDDLVKKMMSNLMILKYLNNEFGCTWR